MTDFNARFKEAVKDIPIEEICRTLKISKFTYNRWVEGKSAPHPVGREAVFNTLKNLK